MKLAFSRPTSSDAEQRELYARFRAAGFDGLQLKAGQYHRYIHDPTLYLKEWGDDLAAASALIAGGVLDAPGRAALRELVTFARVVKSERIVFCHGASRTGQSDDDLIGHARILSELGHEAAENGIRLSLHHHYDQPVMRRRDFDVFFGAVESGSVGLTIDTAHLVKSGIRDVAALIRDMQPVIDNIHLKDFAAGEFKVLGRGEIDFEPVFAAINDIQYDGWICADEESGGALAAGLKECSLFLHRLI